MRTRAHPFSAVLTVLAVLLLGVSPAAATVVHHKVGSFTGSDAPGGPFGPLLPSDAVDQSNGDVWVAESNAFGVGQNVVTKFNQAGEYASVQLTGAKFPGQEAFAFGFSSGVAVDNSTGSNKGDLYVADTEHHVVDRFSAAGKFLCQITGRTPKTEAEMKHECHGAEGSLTPDGSLEPAGVAVNSSGDVFVADDGHTAIDEFGGKGEYLSQIKDSHLSGEMGALAVDPAGALYVTNLKLVFGTVDDVVEFNSAGSFTRVLDERSPLAVAVDPSTSHVYVHDAENEGAEGIAEYESSGGLLDLTPTPQSPGLGLAVDGASGRIYSAELSSGSVSIYSGDIVIPTVTSLPATNVTETAATLNGHLDPDAAHGGGQITGCEFEWGETAAYGHVAPCTPGAPYSAASDVSAPISALAPASTYHFRLKATNANGSSESPDETFTTAGVPAIDAQSSHVTGVQAVLSAKVNPLHLETMCHVQYVDDASFSASGYTTATTLPCAPERLGSGFADVAASATLNGLKVGTTYHYRFLAANSAGPATGPNRTFATFGVHAATFELLDREEKPFTQAGGVPYELRTGFTVNWTENVGGASFNSGSHPKELPTGNVRTVLTDLPPGLIGNPSAATKCTRTEVINYRCSGAAQVGQLTADEANGGEYTEGIYNLVPPRGVVAEFGANVERHVTVYIDARLRLDGDYALTAESQNNSAVTGVTAVAVHIWGVPADSSHDAERKCPSPNGENSQFGPCSAEEPHPKPLLFNPTSCGGPLTTTLAVDSYQALGLFDGHSIETPPITGCDQLAFSPMLEARPTTGAADSPTGLHVDLHIPQQPAIDDPASRREADLRDTSVTLPAGLTTNAAAANGLAACSPAEIGLTSAVGVSPATFSDAPAGCPDASKIGTVEVDTPLLDHPLPGAVYIAAPYDNPFDSLLAIYIAIEDPQTGVVIKLAGHVEPNPTTGQLTTTFTDSPQLPFEDFKLDFFAGPHATLATPDGCGSYAASVLLTPWSTATAVSPAVAPFAISSACVSGFAPAFTAGTLSPQAGAYAPLTMSFSRADSDQELSGLTVTLPPGLVGKLAGVALCPEGALAAAAAKSGAAEAASPTCPPASQVGSVNVGSGSGEDPFFLPGKAYLTGAYNGGPYGLAVVVPVLAGPFDLGTVVVRSSLRIDPHTAQVTAVSDPFPTILKGIPVRLRRVDVTIDRPNFALNPTNCTPMAFSGALTSTDGASAPLSERFQAGGCSSLAFKPDFLASTSGVTSKANGASLTVRVSQRPGEANIHAVQLQLPLALPSRLTTLQKACSEAQFNTNPAGCPEGSKIGTATAHTPLLSDPLSGPAYIVSHGGAAFPDIEFLLSGDGVRIVLDGKTDIKKGITYSRFETVPDAPISAFETVLPEGPHSVLAAYGNLCATKAVPVRKRVAVRRHGRIVHVLRRVKKLIVAPLPMPTSVTAQNGAVMDQTTEIAVTGCPKVKISKKAARARRRKAH